MSVDNQITPAPASHAAVDDLPNLYSETTPEGGIVRLSKWPEGYVLWYHGEIVWRSWLNKSQRISVTLSADTKPVQDAISTVQRSIGSALLDVAAERQRQIEAEGWAVDHDDQHTDFSLAKAAAIYTVGATLNGSDRAVMDTHGADGAPGWMKELWPWDIAWWKPTGRRRDLVKAAALIIAEIERLDRAKYLNLVDGKVYELISREGDMVAFKREGSETPYYLCSEEFDRRFKLQPTSLQPTDAGQ